MENNILTTVKLQLGMPEEYKYFDNQLLVCINNVFLSLEQIGALPALEQLVDDSTTWDAIFSTSEKFNTLIQNFVCMKTKMLFDPPTGSVKEAYESALKETEWRVTVYRDELDGD